LIIPDRDLTGTLQAALGDGYALGRELGRGGMGVVFLARDVALDREVAVKVLSPELAPNRLLAERFIAEARLIARVRHPNIVSVYSAGTADGLLFYVMDHIPGDTLRDLLRQRGRLEPELASQIAAEIASALDAAARAGVVHRDIKPENILIEQTGSGYRALLADFGIAHAMTSEDHRTGPGMAMGTPAYMSPEQAAGEGVDARSDLYSLGIVTFEMLAGRPPFEGPRRTVISRQIVDPAPPLDRIRPGTPPHLVMAVAKALEKTAEQRWQSGEEFRRALLGGPQVTVRPPRRRARIGIVAALGLTLLALGFTALRPAGPAPGANPRHSFLILPFGNLREDETIGWLAAGSVSMLDLALSQWRDLKVVGQERVFDMLQESHVLSGEVIGLDQARRLARQAGVWTVVLGEFDRTADSLHLVARTYDVRTGDRLDVAEAWSHLGDDVRPLFDQLAAKLLDLSGAPAGLESDLAGATSTSLEAYRAYLRGLGELNTWNLGAAEAAFAEAVAIDSTFSLAFFRLAVTRGWRSTARDTLTGHALAEATRFGDRLPAREQTMIRAYRAMINTDYPEAQQLYGQLVARDSADADAWYGLGDAWFHDTEEEDHAQAMTHSLRAFRRTLALDPRFGLAYEHVSAMLTQAAVDRPVMALMPGDRFVQTAGVPGPATLRAPTLAAAGARARVAAMAAARAWTEYQPGTPRAYRALLEASLASGDPRAALEVVPRIAALWPEPVKPLADFLEARIRFSMGDAASAATILRNALAQFEPSAVPPSSLEQQAITDVLAGANVFAFLGDLAGAEAVIHAADQLRRTILPPGSIVDAYGDDRVWADARLAALHSSAGAPSFELRELWRRVSRAAGAAPEKERPALAWAGASAAQGLLIGPAADRSAVDELQALTGVPPRAEIRALAAVTTGDSATARAALAERDRETTSSSEKAPALLQAAAFAMGDPRPIAAEVRFLLGDYSGTVSLLENFQPSRFGSRSFDSRWGLLARVRLLRGLALERLGRTGDADREFRDVVAQWQGADDRLLSVVQEARAGLARLRGIKG
jgi:serine/threonine-protein kinase